MTIDLNLILINNNKDFREKEIRMIDFKTKEIHLKTDLIEIEITILTANLLKEITNNLLKETTKTSNRHHLSNNHNK